MLAVALRMLFGDRTKYLTLVMGLAFAALLMNQQGAIFMGLLNQATGPLQNVTQADLWVTDPGIQWVAEYRFLSDEQVSRVRSVEGVAWAEPFYNGFAVAELSNGDFKRCQILGIPRTTLAGQPAVMVEGRIDDLWAPDALIIEEQSAKLMNNAQVGDVIKLNDRRGVVVGICKARRGFESNAIIYTTFDNAVRYSPVGRKRVSYILVKLQEGAIASQVQERIAALGDVSAMTTGEFRRKSIAFIVAATGIGINFGITIALGFVVGLLLSASIFYQFTVENIRHFAVLKALGARTRTLVAMVMLQALTVGTIGYGIGAGAAGAFTITTRKLESELSAYLPWELLVGSFLATLLTIGLGSLLSIRRVIKVPPALVFSGM